MGFDKPAAEEYNYYPVFNLLRGTLMLYDIQVVAMRTECGIIIGASYVNRIVGKFDEDFNLAIW